jgi:hypothetical protein
MWDGMREAASALSVLLLGALLAGLVTVSASAEPQTPVAPNVAEQIEEWSRRELELAGNAAKLRRELEAVEAAQRAAKAKRDGLMVRERNRLGLPATTLYDDASRAFVAPVRP